MRSDINSSMHEVHYLVVFFSYGKTKSHQNDSLNHKKELQRKILAARKAPHSDSGIEDDKDLTSDNAIELMGISYNLPLYFNMKISIKLCSHDDGLKSRISTY